MSGATVAANPKWMMVTGWVLSALPAGMMLMGGAMALVNPDMAAKGMGELGFPPRLLTMLGVLEIGCAVVYLFPRTAVLGALLLTGYLGGATAIHARVEDPKWVVPVVVGVVVWLGVFLRDPRVRVLLPWAK